MLKPFRNDPIPTHLQNDVFRDETSPVRSARPGCYPKQIDHVFRLYIIIYNIHTDTYYIIFLLYRCITYIYILYTVISC